MRKLIRKFLENLARTIGDITFLNWNERNITVNWNYKVGIDKVTSSTSHFYTQIIQRRKSLESSRSMNHMNNSSDIEKWKRCWSRLQSIDYRLTMN
ncbi:MAG: hypothetical protein IPG24_08910 [Leptospiraceae bacterium]|nr:hypothetical protein [Leptospiraceae bacterium]